MKHSKHRKIVKKAVRKAYRKGKVHGRRQKKFQKHPKSGAHYIKRGGIQRTG